MNELLIYKIVKHTRTIVDTALGREIQSGSTVVYEGTDKSIAESLFTSEFGVSEFGFGETLELFIFNINKDELIRYYERTK